MNDDDTGGEDSTPDPCDDQKVQARDREARRAAEERYESRVASVTAKGLLPVVDRRSVPVVVSPKYGKADLASISIRELIHTLHSEGRITQDAHDAIADAIRNGELSAIFQTILATTINIE